MWKLSNALFSYFKFTKFARAGLGVATATATSAALLLAGFLFAPGGFAQGASAASVTTKILNCKYPSNPAGPSELKFCSIIEPSENLNCPHVDPKHPFILEPSGLTHFSWKGKSIWVGVSDNYNDLFKCSNKNARGYVVFYFDATKKTHEKEFKIYNRDNGNIENVKVQLIEAKPLLTIGDAKLFNPYDLEGIEYDKGTDTFYMTGSLGKHASNAARDTWHRYKVYQFKVPPNVSPYTAVDIKESFSNWGWDFRDWVLSEENIYWGCLKPDGSINCYDILKGVVTGRPENQGGLNIEALALAPEHDANLTALLFGLRGPVFFEPPFVFKGKKQIYSSFLDVRTKTTTIDPQPQPILDGQFFVRTENKPQEKSIGFGLRAMTHLSDTGLTKPQNDQLKNIYAVILGATDGAYDQLKAGLIKADPLSGVFYWIDNPQTLPSGFVGEGIAISNITSNSQGTVFTITAQMVSDLNAYFMEIEFTYTP